MGLYPCGKEGRTGGYGRGFPSEQAPIPNG